MIAPPTLGFDPSILSNQQSYERAHVVERNGIREWYSGEGIVSGEETADNPKPRMPIPQSMLRFTKGDGVSIEDQCVNEEHGYRPMHHPHCSWVVWDCGNGMVQPIPYHEAPIWAQPDKGRFVSLPASGDNQRRASSDYRKLFAENSVRCQKEVLVLLPPGSFWTMDNPAQFDDTREQVRSVARVHKFLVIEGDCNWANMQAFMNEVSFHCYGDRSESTSLAGQWQHFIAVIDHAAIVLCHQPSWDEFFQRVPRMSYTSGDSSVFYGDMVLTIVGPNPIEPVPHLMSQRFNTNALCP